LKIRKFVVAGRLFGAVYIVGAPPSRIIEAILKPASELVKPP
jgi:hypothetical protein